MKDDLATDYNLRKWIKSNKNIPKDALLKVILPSLLVAAFFIVTSRFLLKEAKPNLLEEGIKGFVIGLLTIFLIGKNQK